MRPSACRVAVLGSGEGTNFEALAAAAGGADWDIVAVGSDQPRAPILERARRRAVPAFAVPRSDHPDRAGHERAVAAALRRYSPDLVLLAGYMRLLGPVLLDPWRGRMLNVHPSLLPRFPGLDTHARALAAGVRAHGATIHFVTPELDAGPRVLQGRLGVGRTDTVASLRRRVRVLEHRIYPLAAGWFAAGRLRMVDGEAVLDGRVIDEPEILEEDACA